MAAKNRLGAVALAACLGAGPVWGAAAELAPDAIAKVGDQVITMSQIDTMINSSTMVGMSIPASGTPERNRARIALLDKLISANLLYLDAKEKAVGDTPLLRQEIARFAESVLGGLYEERYLIGQIEVTDADIDEYARINIAPGTEISTDARLAIEAKIRKERFQERVARMRDRLRRGMAVTVHDAAVDPGGDPGRGARMPVATIDGTPITWGEVRDALSIAATTEKRMELLEGLIDERIMAIKGRQVGLEKDPVYLARVGEFEKTRLINFHRSQVVKRFSPRDEEIRAFYEKNKDGIVVPESRKVQMVVLEEREEAEAIKKKIDSGEISIHEAARDHSVDPNAKKTLGEIGWVTQGTGFPELDTFTFSLEPHTVGGPVQSPAGWHLVKVLDVRDAQFTDLSDPETRRKTRRMFIHTKLGEYTAKLRRESFPVEVYQEVISRIVREEAGV